MMHDASGVVLVRRRRECSRKEIAWPLGTAGLCWDLYTMAALSQKERRGGKNELRREFVFHDMKIIVHKTQN